MMLLKLMLDGAFLVRSGERVQNSFAITFMADKEVAMTSLQNKIRRRSRPVIPQNAPKGDSQSNGLAEKAVRGMEEQVRSLRSCVESDMGARLPVHHPVITWLVEAAADYLNRFKES